MAPVPAVTAPGMRTGQYFAGIRAAEGGPTQVTPHIRPLPARPSEREIHDANALYVARIVSWHRIVPRPDGRPSEWCSCQTYAVMCPYLRASHDILGHPMPWDVTNPPDVGRS